MQRVLILFVSLLAALTGCKHQLPQPQMVSEWTDLLDKDLSKFDKFIGVPHYSITTLPGYPKGDGMNGTPLGLNNDPLGVFSTEVVDGDTVLHISGEIYGGLSTRQEYGNYHFQTEFKWGEKKYEPRLTAKRDNGILYHCYGPHGSFWNVWMNSQEMQVQEGDMGDYFALGPAMDIRAAYRTEDGETAWIYDDTATLKHFGDGGGVDGRCRRGKNNESPHGAWNTLELICVDGESVHIVNGMVVMRLQNSSSTFYGGAMTYLTQGKIQIQSEGAEAYYRNMRIRSISEIPEVYR